MRYHAGPYAGTREVWAETGGQAVATVRDQIRQEMALAMYADSYQLEGLVETDAEGTESER